jgi:hypothetical protein
MQQKDLTWIAPHRDPLLQSTGSAAAEHGDRESEEKCRAIAKMKRVIGRGSI